MIPGILPCVRSRKQNRDAISLKSALLYTEVDSEPDKRPKHDSGEGSVALLKTAGQPGCVFQDSELPKSKSILRKVIF